MTDRLEQNKRNVMAFYDLMFNECKPAEAIERFTGETYIQHNPGVGDGKEAFITYFTRVAEKAYRARKNPVYDAACFHCQQCAEKYLKARLVEAGIAFAKTHDLLSLLSLVLPVEPGWLALHRP
jgi:hypothetical protein